jgi:hypothetical protein
MSMRRLAAGSGIAILSACFQAAPARAAGAAATDMADAEIRGYAAEGPIFKLPAGVRIARQDIEIAPRSVKLTYVFQAAQRHIVPFSFNLPEMPADASPDAISLSDGGTAEGLAADRKPVNYLSLSVQVNGAPLALSGQGRARLDGVDVTRVLLDAGVPLLYDLTGEAPWPHLPAQTRAILKARGLIGEGVAYWNYQARYTWDQVFEPGETRIEIRYAPQAFYWSDISLDDFPAIAPGGWATRAYCIDEAWRRAFFRYAGSGAGYELYAVRHVLTPEGALPPPAARYRLMVDKYATSNLVAFCPPASRKTSPSTFTWQAGNVTPGRSVEALFFMNPHAWPNN